MKNFLFSMLAALSLIHTAAADEKLYPDVIAQIKQEARANAEVMENAWYLTDVYGPRLALSPSYDRAVAWTVKKLKSYGLNNASAQSYGEVGVGWSNEYTAVHMVTPTAAPLLAYPASWSAGTRGKRRGKALIIDFDSIHALDDLKSYRKQLRGAIVLTAPEQKLEPHFRPDATRLTERELDQMASGQFDPLAPADEPPSTKAPPAEPLPREEIIAHLMRSGVLAIADPGRRDFGTVVVDHVDGEPWRPGAKNPVSVVIATEHYNRIARLVDRGMDVELALDIRNTFHDDDLEDYNVIADIPGSDLAGEIVLVGAHLDGMPSGTGATDNAAGSVVAIEAMRILKAIGVKPRRTIRLGLWGAEEIGLKGSRGYVRQYLGNPENQQYKPGHGKFSVNFNLDTGTGKLRGLWLQENEQVRPIFEAWLKPFHIDGATHLDPTNTSGTDHEAFDAVGLPGFTFIQDLIAYETRTTHSNMDVYDRLLEEDLIQASAIMASFAYHAAMRDEKLPRVLPAEQRESPDQMDK